MDLLRRIAEDLERGEAERVRERTREALATGIAPGEVLHGGLVAAMSNVGERFRKREIFLPDVLLAAQAMYAGLGVLEPHLAQGDVPLRGKVVIGTVRGDLHDIGKNLVGILLRGAGFEVIDLGHDVPAESFVRAAEDAGAPLIGLSALLTTTMPRMREVVDLLRERGLAGRIKTIVGGAPLSAEYARSIGADDYAFDAAHAVERVKALIGAT